MASETSVTAVVESSGCVAPVGVASDDSVVTWSAVVAMITVVISSD